MIANETTLHERPKNKLVKSQVFKQFNKKDEIKNLQFEIVCLVPNYIYWIFNIDPRSYCNIDKTIRIVGYIVFTGKRTEHRQSRA